MKIILDKTKNKFYLELNLGKDNSSINLKHFIELDLVTGKTAEESLKFFKEQYNEPITII